MILGKDEHAKVMLVIGREKRFKIYSEEGWKIIYLRKPLKALSFDRKSKIRPVPAGVSIGHINITAGTLGGIVLYQNEIHGITNSHIVTDKPESPYPPEEPQILQPAPYDGGRIIDNTIGFYVKHYPISVSEKSLCKIAKVKDVIYNRFAELFNRGTRSFSFTMLQGSENPIDAGIFEPAQRNIINEQIVDDNGNALEVKNICGLLFAGSTVDNIMIASRSDYIEKLLGVQFLYDIKIPDVGETVFKSGRTTGITHGEVLATDMTTTVEYNTGIATMTHCIVVRLRCAGGDSGSPVFIPKR
ncbi:MAG: hypothetical protein QW332_06025 [Thermoproteota archaeon]